jgi:predicted ATPase
MLTRATFKNYRCLRDVTIDFEPLTVLVGGNGVGKSSVLRALQLDDDIRPVDAWRRGSTQSTWVDLHYLRDHDRRFVLRKSVNQNAWLSTNADVTPSDLRNMARPPTQLVRLSLDHLRSSAVVQKAQKLDAVGANLVNVFESIPRNLQAELVATFCKLVPLYSDVTAVSPQTGHKRVEFHDRWDRDLVFEPQDVSDGTLLVLAYLLLQYQKPQVELVCIEEPERGLHPFLLGDIVGLLRKMATGGIGTHPVQIVMATQSAELLDHLQPSEVRFLSRRTDDGAVEVKTVPPDSEHWRAAYRQYENSLGKMWLSGGLGGVPGA